MKKKRLLLFGATTGICMVSVFLLLGSMGIYAEQSGTGEWAPDPETESVSSLMDLNEAEDEAMAGEDNIEDANLLPDEELRDIWEKMYAEYLAQLELSEEDPGYDPGVFRVEYEPGDIEEKSLQAGDTGYLDGVEAGVILLKEINRLYPMEDLKSFKINRFQMNDYGVKWENSIPDSKYEWDGYLYNGNEITDPEYVAYQFTINALSGKIMDIFRSYPYQKDADYWDTVWTEEEVKERGRQLIEKYHLAEGKDLDWETVSVSTYDAEQIAEAREELEEDPGCSMGLWNVLIFYNDGQQLYLGIDWATGELAGYDCFD